MELSSRKKKRELLIAPGLAIVPVRGIAIIVTEIAMVVAIAKAVAPLVLLMVAEVVAMVEPFLRVPSMPSPI